MEDLNLIGKKARAASYKLAAVSTFEKNNALLKIADAILENADYILSENKKDIENAKSNNMSESLIDRLMLNHDRIKSISDGIKSIVALEDPVGEVISSACRPNGLNIKKVRVPIGVIGIIYEARPNVTADACALTLKSGNAVILRGGSDAIHSNIAIIDTICLAAEKCGLPEGTFSLIKDTSRESANKLMRLNDYLDVIIPRGGKGLIRSVIENSTVPVIQTGEGNCHIFVDKSADFNMAKDIIINAKTSRPSVCNAQEKLLIHETIAENFLKVIIPALKEKNVTIIGDNKTKSIFPDCILASDEDWETEYLDLKIAIKVVKNVDEAIEHINTYSTMHSEAIITENAENAEKFTTYIDSAAVYVNASTRFTDGGEFGFGAEIGISTQKLHARGPMGLKELTSIKYIISGNGQIR